MYQAVLDFWFKEITPAKWWKKDLEFDQLIQKRFGKIHEQANQGELYAWRHTPEGRLAEIIVLDQFSRNIYRDSPRAFASDALALVLAQEAITHKTDQHLAKHMLSFLYMPFMHSESLEIHEMATSLFKDADLTDNYHFELKHKVIIERFGRYPHRNALLGRSSTAEEIEFLTQPGSSF